MHPAPGSLLQQDLTAQGLALARGDVTSLALTEAVLQAIAQRQPQLKAYLHIDASAARQAAASSDARRAAGRSLGPLDGLTLAVKDNIDVAGMPTTAGMATRRGRLAQSDAFVVRRLREAGMVVLGKLNMHEAALGATNDNPHFGRCENPLRAGFTPGGSSGGSACAVAAGLCALALGTDTMGSVRIPAAYCGVVGFKPSWGWVSTGGSVACCWALDHVGALLRSRRDLALVLPVMAAFDAQCPDARPARPAPLPARPRFVVARDGRLPGATPPVAEAYQRALAALRGRGEGVAEIDLGEHDFGPARRAGLVAVEADLLVEHGADWHSQPQNFSPQLAHFMRYGQRLSAADLAAALRTLAAVRAQVASWFELGDVLVLPTAPQTAFAFGDPVPANQADYTALANFAGLPALSVPLPVAADALPVGLQLVAPPGADATLLALDLQGICCA